MLKLVVLVAFVICVAALNLGNAEKTIKDVRTCFEAKHQKCRSDCAVKIPADKTATVQCFAQLKEQKMAAMKQCFTDAGLTDSSPCFSFNHTHGHWGKWGSQHERRNDSSSAADEQPQGVDSNKVEDGERREHWKGHHGGRFGGKFGRRGGPEMREYHQCLKSCAISSPQCDTGCPAATEETRKIFRSCRHGGHNHDEADREAKRSQFMKCINPQGE